MLRKQLSKHRIEWAKREKMSKRFISKNKNQRNIMNNNVLYKKSNY